MFSYINPGGLWIMLFVREKPQWGAVYSWNLGRRLIYIYFFYFSFWPGPWNSCSSSALQTKVNVNKQSVPSALRRKITPTSIKFQVPIDRFSSQVEISTAKFVLHSFSSISKCPVIHFPALHFSAITASHFTPAPLLQTASRRWNSGFSFW